MTIFVGSATSGLLGGGGALSVATRSDTSNPAVFANFAALETYTATSDGTADAADINVSDAGAARQVFAVGTLDGSNNVTAITAAYIRVNDAWVAVATNLVGTAGADGADGTALEFSSETERDTFFVARPDLLRTNLPVNVFMGGDVVTIQLWKGATNPPTYDPATQSVFWIPASVRTGTSSLELGEIHTISSGGENVFFNNGVTDVSYFPPWQSVGNHSTPEGRVVENIPNHRVYEALEFIEPRGAALTSGAVEHDATTTLTRNQSIFGLRFIPAENYTGQFEYRVTHVDTGTIVFSQVQTGTVVIDEELIFWFRFPVEGFLGQTVRTEILKEDGTHGLSRPSTDNPTEPYIEIRTRDFNDVPMASSTDLTDHPVTLRRDMPSEVDATALAAASLNDNSALWIVANNQLSTSNRSDATIRALQSGFLDLNGNTIPITAVAANTIQLRGGTIVRVFSANEYRVVNSPVFESDITPPTDISTQITRFEIQGQSTSVVSPITLSGTQTFNYNVNHPEDVSGNLSLVQDGSVLRSDISPTNTSFTQAITSVTLNNNQEVVFELRGTTDENIAIQKFFRVRAHAPAEQLFYGLSTSNNPVSVSTDSFRSTEAGVSNTTIQTGAVSDGNYFIILAPSDHDISSITDTVLQQDVLSIFTKTESVRTLNSVPYDSYVVGPLNAGVNEEYVLSF